MTIPTEPATSDLIEFNLVDVLRRVVRGKRLLLVGTLTGLILGTVISIFWKPWFEAQAVFLPPKATDFSTAMPTASSLLGSTDTSDVYLGMLGSRTIQDDVIDRMGLIGIYHAPNHTRARLLLTANSSFSVGRNTLISVNVKASNPKLAADIANAYLDALYRLNGQMVESSSVRRSGFFKEQLEQQRDALMKAEDDLRQSEERTGVVLPAGEAQAGINATARTQAQIDTAEATLAGLLVGETDQAPDVVQVRAQLGQLRAQLSHQLAAVSKGQDGVVPTGTLPALTLDVAQKERDVKLSEAAYESLLQQYGRARLASIDPGPQFQIVDHAVPPEYKAGPSRRLLILGGLAAGFFLALFYLLFFEPLRGLVRRANQAVQA